MQQNLIWEIIFYEFQQSPGATEATKNIYCAKGEDALLTSLNEQSILM